MRIIKIHFSFRIIWISSFLLIMQMATAQSKQWPKHTVGASYGLGIQAPSEVNFNNQYEVNLFSLEYYHNVFEDAWFRIDVFAFPQLNRTKFRPTEENASTRNGFEYGVNGGFQFYGYMFKGMVKPYVMLGIGPHYVSSAPSRQRNGFIFSDNFAYGVVIALYEEYHLDLRFGYRHISNGGLKKPNGGIDNRVATIGIIHPF